MKGSQGHMNIDDFSEGFFEEADDLITDMERCLLDLDIEDPDAEQLNAIFRAAHSIKGGAGAFGFSVLQETTHILENVLDHVRRGELALQRSIVDLFLESRDVLQSQLNGYRHGTLPDATQSADICARLQQLAPDKEQHGAAARKSPQEKAVKSRKSAEPAAPDIRLLAVALIDVSARDRELLLQELTHFGEVVASVETATRFEVTLKSSETVESIAAVMGFIVEPEQLEIHVLEQPLTGPVEPPAPNAAAPARPEAEASSIRVPVEKIDSIINLVGELIITQSMLEQGVREMELAVGKSLAGNLGHLQRNARDLQEAVMSIRMLPMDYVFSRFPRQIRDLAGKLGKEVELVTEGKTTELDKGLIERITDPLTHLVRNSLDHGIESPAVREAAGKPRVGRVTLSAKHQGGNVIIEVADDGAGLNREKLLAKARANGLPVSDAMTDDEVWQLIFAPGFSTAELITDVSGRGVGMDVVKRNIQALAGHVEIASRTGEGTTTRIVLPLTLAILEGLSVKSGEEMFILPLSVISELLQPAESHLFTMAGDDVLLKVRDEYLPVVALHEVMGVAHARSTLTDCIAVIVHTAELRYALLIDEPIGQQQVVVKNLESNYHKVPGVSAATILGNGKVALILDVVGLYRHQQGRKQHQVAVANKSQSFGEIRS